MSAAPISIPLPKHERPLTLTQQAVLLLAVAEVLERPKFAGFAERVALVDATGVQRAQIEVPA